MGGDALQVGR